MAYGQIRRLGIVLEADHPGNGRHHRARKQDVHRQSRRVFSEGGFGIGRGIHGDNAVSAVSADSDIAYPRWVDRSVIDSAVNNKHIELVMICNIPVGHRMRGGEKKTLVIQMLRYITSSPLY